MHEGLLIISFVQKSPIVCRNLVILCISGCMGLRKLYQNHSAPLKRRGVSPSTFDTTDRAKKHGETYKYARVERCHRIMSRSNLTERGKDCYRRTSNSKTVGK